MFVRFFCLVFIIGLLGFVPFSFSNEVVPCPEPPGILRGLTFRTSTGPAKWTGEIGKDSALGYSISFGAGWEWLSWLATEAFWTVDFHDSDQAYPPAAKAFSTQAVHVGLRLNLEIDRFDLFLRGGGGILWSRPDIFVRMEEFNGQTSTSWMGGAGFIWHTLRRRFCLGFEISAMGAKNWPGILLSTSVLLGVTL
jgi:hypothetical protein